MEQRDPGGEPPRNAAYWLQQPVEARWREVERLRRLVYGDAACDGPIQRVIRIIPQSAK